MTCCNVRLAHNNVRTIHDNADRIKDESRTTVCLNSKTTKVLSE